MKKLLISIILNALALAASAQTSGTTKTTEWDDYFMPGVGYKTYIPKNADSLGTYHGIVTEFIIYAQAKGDESWRSGPARVKTFGNLSIMKSTKQGVRDIFFSNFGVNLSFEGKIKRKFFIPVFGLEVGGLYQRNFSTFHFTPTAGMQLASTQHLVWTIYGGYQYTTRRFDEYSGYLSGSTLNVLLWH
jgi:hypothetical protein